MAQKGEGKARETGVSVTQGGTARGATVGQERSLKIFIEGSDEKPKPEAGSRILKRYTLHWATCH